MQWVEASAAAIIASTMPLMVAAFGWLFLGERLRPMALAGLVIGVSGVALVMGVRLGRGLDLPAALLLVFGAGALAAAALAARGAGTGRNVMMGVGLQMLVGAAALLPPAVLTEWGRPIAWSVPVIAAFAFSVLLPGLFATWLWLRLVVRIGAVRAATFHFLSPIFGVLIAALLLGEHFGAVDVIGAAVVAAGILMVQLSKLPPAAR